MIAINQVHASMRLHRKNNYPKTWLTQATKPTLGSGGPVDSVDIYGLVAFRNLSALS